MGLAFGPLWQTILYVQPVQFFNVFGNRGHVDAYLHITLSASGGESCVAGASEPLIISPYMGTVYQYQELLLHPVYHTIFIVTHCSSH